MTNENQIETSFSYISIEGSSYDVGKKQGEIMKRNPQAVKYFTSGNYNPNKSGFNSTKEIIEFYDTHVPGLADEFQGYADALGVKLEALMPLDYPNSVENHCSHLVALPKITKDGHTYVARTYDWHYDDEDMRLVSTRVLGKLAHLGFSTLLAGRTDGINSKGVCIAMAGGGAWEAPILKKRALNFSFGIRAVLDSCKNTAQSVELLTSLPINTSTHYLIADKKGHAAIVESIDCKYSVREIDLTSETFHLFSTNEYQSQELAGYNQYVNDYLLDLNQYRTQKMSQFITDHTNEIDKHNLMRLLTDQRPNGLCAPFYSDWFGVLWSMVFDVTTGKVMICMGTPGYNDWQEFEIGHHEFQYEIEAVFVDGKR